MRPVYMVSGGVSKFAKARPDATFQKDAGKPFLREAAIAKLFASEAAMRSTIKEVQISGGYGYIREYPVERYMQDAKMCEIGEGTPEVQRMFIARRLIRGH
jgi:butyryl-CoA dehydrogenase